MTEHMEPIRSKTPEHEITTNLYTKALALAHPLRKLFLFCTSADQSTVGGALDALQNNTNDLKLHGGGRLRGLASGDGTHGRRCVRWYYIKH